LETRDDKLQRLLKAIFDSHADNGVDCETCENQFDCLAELVLNGANLAAILPAIEEHLRCCPHCHEEFEALLTIVRAEWNGDTLSIARE
jgi:hypothetical protein